MSLNETSIFHVTEPNELYQDIKNISEYEQIQKITEMLVRIPSINGTKGEREIADYIYNFLAEVPFFKKNPAYLWKKELNNDPLGRKNVFALFKKEEKTKTVLYHSHMDTVGVEDYGEAEDQAFSSQRLKIYYAEKEPNLEIQKHALSEDWMFGRGSVDMKSGIAVHISNLLYFIDHPEEIDGNILLMLNPVEENEHTGIIESIPEITELKKNNFLEFQVAINNDFVTELYENDPNIYLYTGAIGKLLPCFSIYGKEAHVGETLLGLDPTLISSEINRSINNNMELTEKLEGEHMLPPTCLQLRDTKNFYNVQTALNSRMYFNYFIYERSPKEVMDILVKHTKEACDRVQVYLKEQYRTFIEQGNYPSDNDNQWDIDVMSFEEYKKTLTVQGIDVTAVINDTLEQEEHFEKRELIFRIIENLKSLDAEDKPKVIIFFAPPFCPHNYLREQIPEEQALINELNNLMNNFSSLLKEKTGKVFSLKKFFPFLSDSSYLSLHDTDEQIDSLVENFPGYKDIYPLPIDEIRKINIPSINMGVYGKDAHKKTERVYMPYTFGVLPLITKSFTKQIINKKENINENN